MYSHRSTCLGKQYTRALLTITWHIIAGCSFAYANVAMGVLPVVPVMPLILLLVEAVAFRPMGWRASAVAGAALAIAQILSFLVFAGEVPRAFSYWASTVTVYCVAGPFLGLGAAAVSRWRWRRRDRIVRPRAFPVRVDH